MDKIQNKITSPWQSTPALLISYALELMEKEGDADHQIAYLLIDVGIETIFKNFLSLDRNKKDGIEKKLERAGFPSLLKVIRDVAGEQLGEIDLTQVEYYHKIRNKLYHQGDGVVPTKNNLKGYSEIAKDLLRNLLEVDLDGDADEDFDFEAYLEALSKKDELEERKAAAYDNVRRLLKEVRSDVAIAVGRARPELARRSFQRKLAAIWDEYPDDDSLPFYIRAEDQDTRVELFNELLHKSINDAWFVDNALQDITFLYLAVVFKEIGWDIRENLRKYEMIFYFSHSDTDLEALEKESKEKVAWLQALQEKIEETFFADKTETKPHQVE